MAVDRASIRIVGLPFKEAAHSLLGNAQQIRSRALVSVALFERAENQLPPDLLQKAVQRETWRGCRQAREWVRSRYRLDCKIIRPEDLGSRVQNGMLKNI